MVTKEELKSMVETVCFKTKQSQEELSVSLSYGNTYISEMLNKRGKVTSKFINAFKLKYGEYLENPKIEDLKKGDQQQEISKDRLLDIIQEQMTWLRGRVDSDLDVLVSGISSISTRQSADREVVFQALSRLSGMAPDALLMEADKKMSGENQKDGKRGKNRATGKNGKKLA